MSPARTFPDGTRPNMFFIGVFVVLCSAIGAAAISSVVAGLLTLVEPSWSKHSTSGLVFILSFPIGIVLGGTFGYVWIKYDAPDKTAGYIFSVVGSLITCICLVWIFPLAREFSVLGLILVTAHPSHAVPLVASLTMLVRGVLLIKRQEKEQQRVITTGVAR